MDAINPRFNRYSPGSDTGTRDLFEALRRKERHALSKALTLLESSLPRDREKGSKLLEMCLPYSGQSLRLGISGVPGVGKSTFIEALGEHLISHHQKRVAVLAIDPSSGKNRGSILGDKTRMPLLAQNPRAFIRPSPSAGHLGGVAGKTREAILLCEAAGYDLIMVETVGVGQSETSVKSMVDFFLLLMLAGAGDELQGIKRGIMEMADLLLINKADGENIAAARRAMGEYKRALHLFPPNENEWIPRVESVSALHKKGLEECWQVILEFERQQKLKGYFEQNRQSQMLDWFENHLRQAMLERMMSRQDFRQDLAEYKDAISRGEAAVNRSVIQLLDKYLPS